MLRSHLFLKFYPLIISTTIGRVGFLKATSASTEKAHVETCRQTTSFYSTMEHDQWSSEHKDEILKKIQMFIPPLTYEQHKGQSGRIGVIGGSEEYTGAPYFAAISALKLGADLSHVFCTRTAATVIKSYSPELIVHPLLDDRDALNKIKEWIPRLHAMVIGPGLGTDPSIHKTVLDIMAYLKEQNKPLVIDADGLIIVKNNLDAIKGYKNAILTPNAVEFKRLVDAIGIEPNMQSDDIELTSAVSKSLGGVVIARKMHHDIISDGETALQVMAKGSPRRCGGQGDLLSGAAAVFFHWALQRNAQKSGNVESDELSSGVLSAYGACLFSKLCAEHAFEKMGRSTTTTDLINEIHNVFQMHFETLPHKL